MANTQIGKFWLLMPWLILALGIPTLLWWTFEPVPVTISYVAPAFLSQPALNRDDAERFYVTRAKGGQILYRYIAYCVSKPFTATARRAWVGSALAWPAPDLPTYLSRTPGCYEANIPVELPTSSPTRHFQFVQTMEIPMNPIRTATIEYAPIPLTILDGKE
jgi:hypothetical protein